MSTRATRSPRRRTVVALAVVLIVLIAFVVRLVDIQVVNAADHVEDSIDVSLGTSQTLYGARGDIVDMNGEVLADSVVLYDAALDPSIVGPIMAPDGETVELSWPDAAAKIASVTDQEPEDIEKLVADKLADEPGSQWVRLKTGLSTEQYRDLRALGLPYLTFEQHPSRSYPSGAVAGNLLGFTGRDDQPLAGLELAQNSCLASENGAETYQKGQDGVKIPGTEATQAPVDGGQLQLTIDADLQWYMRQLIGEQVKEQKAQSGTVMVVEVGTGAVRAAAEFPSVDPNDVQASDPADRGSRIFRTTFEPGSTFKAVTAATFMEATGGTPLSTVTASSTETFPNGARINDPFVHPPYQYTLAGALIDSSNVSLSKFGGQVDAGTRHDYLQKFGVGSVTDIGFPGEEPGVLRPAEQWDSQTYYTTTFGQAFTVTVPQVVGAYQAIANDGVKVPLRLVESCTADDGSVTEPETAEPKRLVSEKTAKLTQRMIENVALQGSTSELVQVDGYRVAAKTGTAQKPAPGGGYKAGVYFTSIIGYAPADDPKYIVMVTLDEPRRVTSSAATAPAFQKAMTQVLKNYRVLPSSSEPDALLPKFAE